MDKKLDRIEKQLRSKKWKKIAKKLQTLLTIGKSNKYIKSKNNRTSYYIKTHKQCKPFC